MNKGVTLKVNGVTYPTILSCARAYGCSPAFIRNALKKSAGDQAELDSIISGYKGIRKQIEVAGCEFPSLRELVLQTGISPKRLRTIQKNCKTDIDFSRTVVRESTGLYVLGRWYWCIKSASKELNIAESTLINLLQRYDYSQREFDEQIKKCLVK